MRSRSARKAAERSANAGGGAGGSRPGPGWRGRSQLSRVWRSAHSTGRARRGGTLRVTKTSRPPPAARVPVDWALTAMAASTRSWTRARTEARYRVRGGRESGRSLIRPTVHLPQKHNRRWSKAARPPRSGLALWRLGQRAVIFGRNWSGGVGRVLVGRRCVAGNSGSVVGTANRPGSVFAISVSPPCGHEHHLHDVFGIPGARGCAGNGKSALVSRARSMRQVTSRAERPAGVAIDGPTRLSRFSGRCTPEPVAPPATPPPLSSLVQTTWRSRCSPTAAIPFLEGRGTDPILTSREQRCPS